MPGGARLVLYAAALTAAVRVTIFLAVTLGRLTFPWEVEVLEGLSIDYAWTLLHGGNLYAPPSAHFAPNWYPPLHYVLSLPFLLLGGFSLPAARLVSITAVALCVVLGLRFLRNAGAPWTGVLLFVAVLFAFYPATGYWYDLARVDSSATLLAFAGVVVLAGAGARPRPALVVAGGVLLALSVFAKQTNLALALGALLFLLGSRDFDRLRLLATAQLATALALAAALWLLYGRDALIIVIQPARHYFSLGWAGLFLGFAWPMLPAAGLAALAARRAQAGPARVLKLLLTVFLCAFGMGLLAACKLGGQPNSSMPAIFVVALALGLAAGPLLERGRHRLLLVAQALLLLALPPWDFLEWIPSPLDRAEARQILADMLEQPGSFLAYNASFVSTVHRGEMYPYWDRLYDWAGGQDARSPFRPDPARYPEDFLRLIRERHFRAVYTNAGDYLGDPVQRAIAAHYRPVFFWRSGMEPGVADKRWRHCVPRLKWLPRAP